MAYTSKDWYIKDCMNGKKYSFKFFETMTGEEITLEKLQKTNIWKKRLSPAEKKRLTDILSNPPFKK